MKQIPLELVAQFAKGNGSVFVGAGLSMGAGMPSWSGLMEPLARELEQEWEHRPAKGSSQWYGSFTDLAQYYENLTSREALIEHVRRALTEKKHSPTKVHKRIVNLPVERIFTTNYDNLLEDAFAAQNLRFLPILADPHLSLIDNSRKSLVKLHGDINNPETIVLTSGDYESYAVKRPGLSNLLGMDLHSKTVLFLGYSFNDHNLRLILSQVSRVAAGLRRRYFAVQLNPTVLAESELQRRGIHVIRLDAAHEDATEALGQWLEEFVRRVRESPVRQPAALQLFTTTSYIGGKLPSRTGEFVGRREAFRRTLDGLRSRYPVVAVKGVAGVGKTRLAVEIGRVCAVERSEAGEEAVIFEYVIWFSADETPGQKRGLDDLLDTIATTTHNTAIPQKQDKEEKRNAVAQLLCSYKMLVIIDGFETMQEDPELITWLERIPYPSKVLITARDGRPKLDLLGAWAVSLEGVAPEEAVDLLYGKFPEQVQGLDHHTVRELARVTEGNPQAMKLALGLVHDGITNLDEFIQELGSDNSLRKVFRDLFAGSWGRLGATERQILLVTPLFAGVSSISRATLQAMAGLAPAELDQGLDRCLRLGLLDEDHGRYTIHPLTRAYARQQLDRHPQVEGAAKRRCTEYFLAFVRENVVRSRPEPAYWNALVSDRMAKLDPEWPVIQQVMTWADEARDDEVLMKLVTLLVHYMDSRFLNRERLELVTKAVAAFHRMGHREPEALLRIDALGWTHVEEGNLDKASDEISRGLDIAEELQLDDLRALGLAWQARVSAERRDLGEATQRIQEALAIPCSQWIDFRVRLAAGDIALKRGGRERVEEALACYQQAARDAEGYGGEGYGYQTTPRIGLALLELQQIDTAEQKFKELIQVRQIPIGQLYAEYGLALVASQRGNVSEAIAMLHDAKAKLSRRTGTNLLLRLIEEQEARMEGSQGPRDPAAQSPQSPAGVR